MSRVKLRLLEPRTDAAFHPFTLSTTSTMLARFAAARRLPTLMGARFYSGEGPSPNSAAARPLGYVGLSIIAKANVSALHLHLGDAERRRRPRRVR
jgi:hypothetical protein